MVTIVGTIVERSRLIEALKEVFLKQSLQLRGVSQGDFSERTWELGGQVPDLIAYDRDNELIVVGQAVICSEVQTDELREKLLALGSLAMEEGISRSNVVPFHVAVPVECEAALKKILEETGLQFNVTVWTV